MNLLMVSVLILKSHSQAFLQVGTFSERILFVSLMALGFEFRAVPPALSVLVVLELESHSLANPSHG
jgi:hypothetical protein